MAESSTDPYGFPPEAYNPSSLPDIDTKFIKDEDLAAFISALHAPDPLQNQSDDITSPHSSRSASYFLDPDHTKRKGSAVSLFDGSDSQSIAAQAAAQAGDVSAPSGGLPQQQHQQQQNGVYGNARPPTPTLGRRQSSMFITAQNDWAPIHRRVHQKRRGDDARKADGGGGQALLGTRTKDETREGYLYSLLKWPMLFFVGAWLVGLSLTYLYTRLYIWVYEQFVTWRGRRQQLRMRLRRTHRYRDWVAAARELDRYLGREKWKEQNSFAYYDSKTVRRVWEQLRRCRLRAEAVEHGGVDEKEKESGRAVEDLKALLEACVKNNFVGVENPRLYSQTYYGTKNLVQNFVDEVEKSVDFLRETKQLSLEEKRVAFKGMHANFGRTALCLSGGASFAYYHFGVVKALLEADLLPDVITGTSGGALVAALVATRTNEELKQLLVPALATRITACREPITTWLPRWWKTGARFDAVDWARQSSWWSRGSMTFREAFERTGRILNVSCVPADPHSPTILCNYLTSPDCVIWSAVLASAAVPGILNPVVLMMKQRDGTLAPYSFGHKWKDGSLRTDIPIKALNLHFNVNFPIVSQVNPHINLFFFSSRGSVGHPVTHRKGKGWRGGYVMSAVEHYLKLDMNKWLRFIRHAELLPRPLGQDWSQLFLQQFSGTVTVWPLTVPSDFVHILSDPDPPRLARMLHEGRQRGFPILKFVGNRLRVERAVERGRRETRPWVRRGSIETILSEEDLRSLLINSGSTDADEDSTDGEAGELTTALENEVAIADDDLDDQEVGQRWR
ncbi:FabD/lysophospholipase-like protein [Sodiomyces alkalinus F11]|uniref:Patatin-like phospholipase domain-containing protein n=1 Tax=Sodiomyces alkalinus (strain CBS 110278 / VKM F-3762 / F11) TaxID=1314773 RepID=A0A3N2PNH8_SODAK|nr:FabD/lysophospholipase-like protein [Sodiomyces alkalinus F11]ROT36049.1 FabD/lysophospholipase-like protein [Sodiomyces alkalinus F11]